MPGFCSSQSTVRLIASRIVSVGRQPSARMRSQSRWISGLSPGQPRTPPVYSSSRLDAQVRGDRRDRVVDDDRLVGAEVVDVHCARLELPVDRERHRRDAVADVEVRLLLAAVAEDPQARRVVAAGSGRSRRRGRACSARRGSRRSERRSPRSRTRARRPGSALRPRASRRRRATSAPGTGTSRAWGRPRARRRPSRWRRTRCAVTPAARIASSTTEVAIVFCSRSRAAGRGRGARRRSRRGGTPCRIPRATAAGASPSSTSPSHELDAVPRAGRPR